MFALQKVNALKSYGDLVIKRCHDISTVMLNGYEAVGHIEEYNPIDINIAVRIISMR